MAGTVGIDVGGTYTDLYFADSDGAERNHARLAHTEPQDSVYVN